PGNPRYLSNAVCTCASAAASGIRSGLLALLAALRASFGLALTNAEYSCRGIGVSEAESSCSVLATVGEAVCPNTIPEVIRRTQINLKGVFISRFGQIISSASSRLGIV